MLIPTTFPVRQGSGLHQKNWGAWFARQWRRWRLRRVRHRYRDELIDLADNPHLLKDIGVTREEALEAAGSRPFSI